jgi:hypothetical protein
MKNLKETKMCKTCQTEKPLSEFHIRGDVKNKTRSRCKECMRKDHLNRYHNKGGKELQAKRSFKNNLKKYSLTPEEYYKLLEDQEGKCKICKSEESHRTGTSYKLFVDHCHRTKKVRGLLCHHCNVGLGHFKDSVNLLETAKEYLNEHSS